MSPSGEAEWRPYLFAWLQSWVGDWDRQSDISLICSQYLPSYLQVRHRELLHTQRKESLFRIATLMTCDLWHQTQKGLQSLDTENDPYKKNLMKILKWLRSFRNFRLSNLVKCAVNFPGERMWASFVSAREKDFSDKKSWGEVRKCKYLYGQRCVKTNDIE